MRWGTLIEEPEFYSDLLDIEGVYLAGDGEFLVGVCNEQVVAMGALRKTSPGYAEIKRMRVAPAFRRRGFGQGNFGFTPPSSGGVMLRDTASGHGRKSGGCTETVRVKRLPERRDTVWWDRSSVVFYEKGILA